MKQDERKLWNNFEIGLKNILLLSHVEQVSQVKIYNYNSITIVFLIDDVFLLRFLRTKKFVMLAAYEMLEQYLKARQLYPQWFQNLDIEDSKLSALVDSGYILPLMQRDSQGRRIVLQSASRFDTNKFSSADSIRLNSLIFGYLMDEEESQICGYVYIIDASKVSLKHVSMFSFVDIKNWLNCLQKAIPTRMKEYHFINLPGYANTIVDFGLSVMSDKMKKRVFYGKNLDELKKHVDEKLLPKEYGGVVPMDTMIEDFKMKLHKYRDKILKNDDQFIIIPKTVTDENISELGIGGSFRKLEVD